MTEPPRADSESGAVLLIVLVLTVTLAVMATSLLSTTELSIRATGTGYDLTRAERAAQSGVEWAAAVIDTYGESAQTTVVPLAAGLDAQVQVVPGASPNVVALGRYRGVAVTVQADVKSLPKPFPYAFASYYGTSSLKRALRSTGPSYLGDPLAPIGSSPATPALVVDGDLDLVSSTPIAAGVVQHPNGVTHYGVAPLVAPVWDTSPFSLMGGPGIYHYWGDTWLANQTINGILVAHLFPGQRLNLADCTINGTIVVPALYDPSPPAASGSPPEILLQARVTIRGGTATTGNLAILAPTATLKTQNAVAFLVDGVSYLGCLDAVDSLTFRGHALLRGPIKSMRGDIAAQVPSGFTANVPIGITWPTSSTPPTITWLGRP